MSSLFSMFIYTCIILLCGLALVIGVSVKCPLNHNLTYCDCVETADHQAADLKCHNVTSVRDLHSIAKAVRNTRINHFYLFNSHIKYLPSDVFLDNGINRLEMSSVHFSWITENGGSPFLGLDDTLKELVLRYCKLTNEVEWWNLRHLKHLRSLDLSFNPLEQILDDMFAKPPPRLMELYLKSCQLKHIDLYAFSAIRNLTVLDLSDNFIVTITRTMFPQPAKLLQFLYFSYNQIRDLPSDFFLNMTDLRTVYLDNNDLQHLHQETWETLWHHSPRAIDVLGNDMLCDESMCWLTFWANPFLRGSCSSPDSLLGRRLLTLWPWEVNCNETLYHGGLSLPNKPRT